MQYYNITSLADLFLAKQLNFWKNVSFRPKYYVDFCLLFYNKRKDIIMENWCPDFLTQCTLRLGKEHIVTDTAHQEPNYLVTSFSIFIYSKSCQADHHMEHFGKDEKVVQN